MRKFIVGTLFGLLLSLSVTVYAEEAKTLVGRTIEGTFPVFLNGKKLSNEAIVIDGTSYLPVREIAEMLALAVKFNQQEGISLEQDETKSSDWPGTVIILPPTEPERTKPTLKDIELQIEIAQHLLQVNERFLNTAKERNEPPNPETEARIVELKQQIAELEKQKEELLKQASE